jgi:hypothetical protein
MNNTDTTNAEPATAAAQGRAMPSVAVTRLEEALVAAAGGDACARRNVQYAGRPEVLDRAANST